MAKENITTLHARKEEPTQQEVNATAESVGNDVPSEKERPGATESAPAEEPAPKAEDPASIAEGPAQEAVSEANEKPRQTAETPAATASLEQQLAEAELRGYMRGRNERIAQLMREPGMLERQAPRHNAEAMSLADLAMATPSADGEPDTQPLILNNPRVSIWDR